MINELIMKFIILILIIIAKSVFASFETAITYLNKHKFNQMCKNPRNKSRYKMFKLNSFINNKMKTFSITRMGLTLTEQLASAFAAEAFVSLLVEKFEIQGINTLPAYIICVVIVTIILAYFTLLFGELLPKKSARNHPERTAYRLVNLFEIFSVINKPFEKILTVSETFFSKLFNIKDEPEEKLTEKEIKLMIAESTSQGLFDENEKQLLYNAIKFDNLKVRDIMIPKEKMIVLNIDSNDEKIINKIGKSKLTRIPLYQNTKDNIIGFINVKDLLFSSLSCTPPSLVLDINSYKRTPLFISRNDKVSNVFKEMQLNNIHIAIVKDAEGKVDGMITQEDIIEKLLGNIVDEFNK